MTDFVEIEKAIGQLVKGGAQAAGVKLGWPNQPTPRVSSYWAWDLNWVDRSRGSLGAEPDDRQIGNVIIQVKTPINDGTKAHGQLVRRAVDTMDEQNLAAGESEIRMQKASPGARAAIDDKFATLVITEFQAFG